MVRSKLHCGRESVSRHFTGYDDASTFTFAHGTDINLDWSVNSAACVPSAIVLCPVPNPVSSVAWWITSPFGPGIDPVNDPLVVAIVADNSFGNNLTAEGGGAEATDSTEYDVLRMSNNVAQNSANLGVLMPGTYSVVLGLHEPKVCITLPCPQYGAPYVAIDIVVQPIPLPGSFPLLAGVALALGAASHRRSRR